MYPVPPCTNFLSSVTLVVFFLPGFWFHGRRPDTRSLSVPSLLVAGWHCLTAPIFFLPGFFLTGLPGTNLASTETASPWHETSRFYVVVCIWRHLFTYEGGSRSPRFLSPFLHYYYNFTATLLATECALLLPPPHRHHGFLPAMKLTCMVTRRRSSPSNCGEPHTSTPGGWWEVGWRRRLETWGRLSVDDWRRRSVTGHWGS